jgi:hypothetical protein
MSPTDPTSALTTRGRSKVMFSYSLNYLIDMEHAVIMDEMTNRHFRFGAGFMLSCPAFPLGGQASNFGYIGMGGAVGFSDPVRKLGFRAPLKIPTRNFDWVESRYQDIWIRGM